jgi:nicotinamidase-related amidase
VRRDKPPQLHNALLVIDVQDSFKAGARWAQRNNPSFEANVTRLIEAFRKRGQLVVYFMDNDDDEHFNPASPYYRLMDFLEPRADERIFHKYSRNCFTTTPLQQLLQQNGVAKVTIAGIKTEQCCETTARVASDLGFDVDFVTEATLTFPISGSLCGGREMPAAEVIERTEYVLRGRFARIRTVAEVVASL